MKKGPRCGKISGKKTTRRQAWLLRLIDAGYPGRIPSGNAAGRAGGKPIPGTSNAAIDQKLLDSQVKLMLDSGVNYFDTSPAYCMGRSDFYLLIIHYFYIYINI